MPTMTVLLVHLPVGFEEAYPLSLAAIASPVLGAGYAVEGLDVGRVGVAGLRRRLARGDVELMGLSVWSAGVAGARDVIAAARSAAPNPVRVVVGGPHPSLSPDDVPADATVVGEGEHAFLSLVEAMAAGRSLEAAAAAPHAPVDLDSVALPDRALFAVADYHRDHLPRGRRYTADVTSRGCRYRCAFCSAPALWGRSHRHRAAARVVEAWRQLRVDHLVDGVLVEDDLFTHDRERVVDLCESLIATPPGVTWELLNGVRPETLDAALLALMRRAGCTRLALSLECADPAQLRAMGRSPDLERARTVAGAARAAGLGVTGYFMLGLPGETAADRRRTFAFAAALRLDMAHFSVASAWPGTRWRPEDLSRVPPRERSAYYAAWYLHPARAWRAGRMLGVRPAELPSMARRLLRWMVSPLEARRVKL